MLMENNGKKVELNYSENALKKKNQFMIEINNNTNLF